MQKTKRSRVLRKSLQQQKGAIDTSETPPLLPIRPQHAHTQRQSVKAQFTTPPKCQDTSNSGGAAKMSPKVTKIPTVHGKQGKDKIVSRKAFVSTFYLRFYNRYLISQECISNLT